MKSNFDPIDLTNDEEDENKNVFANDDHECNDDDPIEVSWIETIPISEIEQPRKQYRHKKAFQWKGIDWLLVVCRAEGNQATVGCFVGFDSSVPKTVLPLSIYTRYHILDKQGEIMVSSTEPCPCEFPVNIDFDENGCIDRGSFDNLFYSEIIPYVDENRVFRMKIELTEVLQARGNPGPGYKSKEATGMVGLENLGATCYLNALLQMLYNVNLFRKSVYLLPSEGEVFESSTTLALQSVFHNLQCAKDNVTTKDLTRAFGWTSQEAFMQQDVQEMMRVLLDKLEEKMKGTDVEGTIAHLFSGSIRSFIKCVDVDYESKREEDFYDVQLDVKDCPDIYASLEKYTTKELLDGENQYDAGEYGKQDANKGVTFTKFPPVLTIHLKRFDFDLQRMAFTKINDNFEFPARLKLDKYLAPDAPETSREHPNTYLLHSVLVHQGDVGGGHYYAYIRPGAGYDKSAGDTGTSRFDYAEVAKHGLTASSSSSSSSSASATGNGHHEDKDIQTELEKTARNGQWFKFNDEAVTKVSPKEAINLCYGARSTNSIYSGGGSAYMLVYIRESDAANIMQSLQDSHIPSELTERLDTLKAQRIAEERRSLREKTFRTIHYATETQVKKFKSFSKHQDFLCIEDMASVRMMDESKLLRLLLVVCDALEVFPCALRLWHIGPLREKGSLRIKSVIPPTKYSNPVVDIAKETFVNVYVEKLTTVKRKYNNEERDSVQQQYRDIRAEERQWLESLAQALKQLPLYQQKSSTSTMVNKNKETTGGVDMAVENENDSNPVEGCGIGSSNKPLDLLIADDIQAEKGKSLREQMEKLTSRLEDWIDAYCVDWNPKSSIVFFRAFDTEDTLPPETTTSDSALSVGKFSHAMLVDKVDGDVKENSLPIILNQSKWDHQQRFLVNPFKYLGYRVFNDIADSNFRQLDAFTELVDKLLRVYVQQNGGSSAQKFADVQIPKVWNYKFNQHLKYYSTDSMDYDCPYWWTAQAATKDEPKALVDINRNNWVKCGRIINLQKSKLTSSPFPLSFDDTFSDWSRYICSRRTIHVQPYSDADARFVSRRLHYLSQEQAQQKGGDDVKHAHGGSDTGSGPLKKRTRNDAGVGAVGSPSASSSSSKAVPDDKMIDMTDNDNPIAPSHLLYDDGDLCGDGGDDDDEMKVEESTVATIPRTSSDVSLAMASPPPPLPGTVFKLDVMNVGEKNNNTGISISQFASYVSDYLGVHPNQLSFVICLKTDEPHDKNPFVGTDDNVKHNRLAQYFPMAQRLQRYRDVKVYYNVLPFPVLTNNLEDLRYTKYRYSEVLLVDTRLREYRRQFLHFLRHQTVSSSLSSSASTSSSSSSSSSSNGAVENINSGGGGGSKKRRTSNGNECKDNTDTGGTVTTFPSICDEDKVAREFMISNKVYTRLKMGTKLSEMVTKLRTIVGLPLDIANQRMYAAAVLKPDDIEIDEDDPSDTVNAASSTGSLRYYTDTSHRVINQHHKRLSHFVKDATEDDRKEMMIPRYALGLLEIQEDIVVSLFNIRTSENNVKNLPASWIEGETAQDCLYHVGLQHFSCNDLIYLTGGTKAAPSMPVTVFSFTLLGSSVKVCPPEQFSGPFISYVREDDDYDSVIARFAMITGEPESEWKNYRLAVVHNKTPLFIPRGVVGATGGALSMLSSAMMADDHDCGIASAAMEIVPDGNGGLDAIGLEDSQLRSSSAWSTQGHSSMNKKKIPTVWEKLLEKFDYETAVDPDKPCPNNFKNDAAAIDDNDKCYFPMIGIQRSVAATNGFTTRTKGRRIASAIKISG